MGEQSGPRQTSSSLLTASEDPTAKSEALCVIPTRGCVLCEPKTKRKGPSKPSAPNTPRPRAPDFPD